VITEDQAREALLEYIAAQCCWGKGAAQKLTFKNLQSSTSYHVSISVVFLLTNNSA